MPSVPSIKAGIHPHLPSRVPLQYIYLFPLQQCKIFSESIFDTNIKMLKTTHMGILLLLAGGASASTTLFFWYTVATAGTFRYRFLLLDDFYRASWTRQRNHSSVKSKLNPEISSNYKISSEPWESWFSQYKIQEKFYVTCCFEPLHEKCPQNNIILGQKMKISEDKALFIPHWSLLTSHPLCWRSYGYPVSNGCFLLPCHSSRNRESYTEE